MIKGKGISMRTAALIAGLPVFLPNAPYGEFYVFGKLINYHDAAQTTQNLIHHPSLFLFGILAVFFNFVIWDIVLAWAVYIFLRPANPHLSLLVAWFRLIFACLVPTNFCSAWNRCTFQFSICFARSQFTRHR